MRRTSRNTSPTPLTVSGKRMATGGESPDPSPPSSPNDDNGSIPSPPLRTPRDGRRNDRNGNAGDDIRDDGGSGNDDDNGDNNGADLINRRVPRRNGLLPDKVTVYKTLVYTYPFGAGAPYVERAHRAEQRL